MHTPQVIDYLIFVVMAGLAVSVGYSAFYEQFLILAAERQVFVTLSYAVIYGGIYVATRLVTKDEGFEGMILKPKTTLQRAVHDENYIFSFKTFCIMALLSGIWLNGWSRYTDEFDWGGAPWLLFRFLLVSSIGLGIFWVSLSVFVYVIFQFFRDIQFSIIFRLCGYVFIHFIVFFVLINATLIWPKVGYDFLVALSLLVPVDFSWLVLSFIFLQFIWPTVLILWSLLQPFKRME